MNAAHLHLIITHVPILGTFFGLALLLIAVFQRNDQLKRTSLWLFLLAGLAAVPTYLSGRPASTLLMKLMPGMSADPGDQHAEIAIIALVCASVLGIVALGGLVLFRKPKPLPAGFIALVAVFAILTSAAMSWTATLGGRIRHTEILPDTQMKTAR